MSSLPFRILQLLDSLVTRVTRRGASATKRSTRAHQDITIATFECRSMREGRCASHGSRTLSRFKTLRHQSHATAEMREGARVQALVTNLDERCSACATIVASATRYLCSIGTAFDVKDFVSLIVREASLSACVPVIESFKKFKKIVQRGNDASAMAKIRRLGLEKGFNDGSVGISGFVISSTAWSLYCFIRFPSSFWDALRLCCKGGGDTDSTAALTAGFLGAKNGASLFPKELIDILHDQTEWIRFDQMMTQKLSLTI